MNHYNLSPLIIVLIFIHASLCAAQPKAQGNPLRDQLQERVAGDRLLDGVRIDRADKKNGVLHIGGIIANNEQRSRLKELAQKPLEFDDPKIVPLDKFKSELQAELSEEPVLRGVRLDRVYFGREGHLQLTGVCWPTPALKNQANLQEELLEQLIRATMQLVIREEDRWIELTKGGKVIVDGMEFFPTDRAPLMAVRTLVEAKPTLDGMHIKTAYYGPIGRLIFTATASTPKQQSTLLKYIRDSESTDANWQAWTGKDSEPTILVSAYIPNDKKISQIENAIARVILSTPPLTDNPQPHQLTDKVLIDRLYYTAENKLALTGLRWNEISAGNQPAQSGLSALKNILEEAQTDDPQLKGAGVDILGLPLFNTADVAFRSPLMAAWDLVPHHGELDGLRLDRAYYKNGVLYFTGIQAREDQTAKLKELIPLTNPLWHTLAPKGIAFDVFPIIPIDTLFDDIQNKYAFHSNTPTLDGARIDRIYYRVDPEQHALRPVFEIDRWFTGQAAGSLQPNGPEVTSIQNILQNHPATWEPVTKWGNPEYHLANERENPLPSLREAVATNPLFDGTRIDRAFYDPSKKLYFTGLIGSEEQLDELERLVRLTLRTMGAGFSDYAPENVVIERDRFQLIPNKVVLQGIQDLLPGYPALDGSAISRLYFAPSGDTPGALTVDGRKAKVDQIDDLADILGQWLRQSFQGRELLKYNANNKVRTNRFDLFSPRHDPFEAMSLLSTAWNIFFYGDYEAAIKKLDMAILYDPGNTQLWMLRSLCYVGLHKLEYARRDARRAVMSMNNNKYRYHGRFKTLSRVQGPLRLCFEALMQEAWASRPNGSIVFLPPPRF